MASVQANGDKPEKAWRSLLFAPANRPELAAKLPRSAPDAVVLDLEDAVPESAKIDARAIAKASISLLASATNAPAVVLRVNGTRTQWFESDVAEAMCEGVTAIIVPKMETATEAALVRAALDRCGWNNVGIIAGIETVRGVADAREVLSTGVAGAYFGAEDYITDLGGVRTNSNDEVAWARAFVAVAARLAGIQILDMIVADIADHERFSAEANQARALGYSGKICIHPGQVALANAAFIPTAEEVARAQRLLAAYDASVSKGIAAIAFEGQMVDEPLARRARQIIDTVG